MIGFSNLDSLISLCGARNRFGALAFAGDDGGRATYTAGDLAKAVGAVKITGDKNAEIRSLIADSRRVAPSSAFFAVGGFTTDGNIFVDEAAHRGAVAVVSENPCPKGFGATWIQVADIRDALPAAAKSFYANPDETLKTFGITGTNGKTSVSWMLQTILNALGEKCGVIGTIHYDLGGRCLPASRTTPDALELHAMLNQMRNASCRAAAMEISSHSIAQKRVKGVHLDCACFLNLTQDHMDYHKTMESYFETKASMFTGALGALPKNAVLNFDDQGNRGTARPVRKGGGLRD